MAFFRNRVVAWTIALILVVASALLGSTLSLGSLRHTTDQMFYNGVQGDGQSIQSDLDSRMDNAYNLVTIARKYMDADDPSIQAVLTARSTLADAQAPSAKCAANTQLTEATGSLYQALGNLSLSTTDGNYRKRLYTNLTSANDTIAHDGYNDQAATFNQTLQGFPTAALSRVVGIAPLEYFR